MISSDTAAAKGGHIVVLTGATFQGSGMNYYILNNAIQWKNMGYRVTVICQDRNAEHMPQVDSYVIGDFPVDSKKLSRGEMRVVIPDINNLIPIYASYQYCQFPGVTSKAVQEMTEEQIETNISKTVISLQAVCRHDRPFKVIANYMILSGIIAARGLAELEIPYDIIVPGPALMYSVYPYPHLWKWVLPAFKKASVIFQHTEFVKTQFLKCFKAKIEQYKLNQKAKTINPGMDPTKFKILEVTKQMQQQLLETIKKKMKAGKSQLKSSRRQMDAVKSEQTQEIMNKYKQYSQEESQVLIKKISFHQSDQVILYIGALINSKGVGELLAIAPKLILQRPTVKFIFCGSGPLKAQMYELLNAYENGDLEQAKLIGQAGQFVTQINIEDHFVKIGKEVRDRIIFGGLFDQQTIHKLYPFATIYCAPSRAQESCNIGIVQAVCSGVTPVCNDHSWFSQVLDNIEKGYPQLTAIIKVGEDEFYKRLASTIVKALDFIGEKRNSKIGHIGYRERLHQIVEQNFSWKHTATMLAEERQYIKDA